MMITQSIRAAALEIANRFMGTPDTALSGKNGKFHVHAFVVFTPNYGADHDIFARLRRSREVKLLGPGDEEQAPSVYFGAILGAQQGEAMNRSITIPGFASSSCNPEKHLFAGLDGDLGRAQPGHLVTAVAVG